ncbi:MAG: hypothetical protein IKW34_00010 [Clostridia bacterium]|nr:hypothetical protein [Clostridia bacterium]
MKYEIFEHLTEIDGEEVNTYGIVCRVNNSDAVRLYDVSTDLISVSEFVESINASRLDPLSLGQALEKYFNE